MFDEDEHHDGDSRTRFAGTGNVGAVSGGDAMEVRVEHRQPNTQTHTYVMEVRVEHVTGGDVMELRLELVWHDHDEEGDGRTRRCGGGMWSAMVSVPTMRWLVCRR